VQNGARIINASWVWMNAAVHWKRQFRELRTPVCFSSPCRKQPAAMRRLIRLRSTASFPWAPRTTKTLAQSSQIRCDGGCGGTGR
jgi:hypothetical protein